MEYDGRREKVMSEREQDLTNTLIKVTTGRQVKAYFVQGHGERDSAGNDRPGYASVVDALKRDNYTVDKVVLAQSQAGVPADASVLIIAGPTADYPEARSRRDQNVPAQRRQGAVPSRSARRRVRANHADARGVAEGVGHHARTRRRHRRQRHGPAARHRRVGTRCRELSASTR